jgi:uncharacterized protein YjiK
MLTDIQEQKKAFLKAKIKEPETIIKIKTSGTLIRVISLELI